MGIVSDFVDYYDHVFSSNEDCDCQLNRMPESDKSQRDQFEFLIGAGDNVPHYGNIDVLLDVLTNEDDLFVVCESPKRLITRLEAVAENPKALAMAFIPHDTGRAVSWRWLQVGNRPFLLEYASDHYWNSQSGNTAIRVIQASAIREVVPNIPYPLWAIDYIPFDGGNQRVAIKFTTSPRLEGTGIEEFLTPSEIRDALIYAHLRFQNKQH
jgi:hypothetical protein